MSVTITTTALPCSSFGVEISDGIGLIFRCVDCKKEFGLVGKIISETVIAIEGKQEAITTHCEECLKIQKEAGGQWQGTSQTG